MKKRFIILMVCLIAAATSRAQQGHQVSKEERISRLAAHLGVTRVKAEEILPALEYNQEKIENIAKDKSLNAANRQTQLRKLNEERQARIKALLSAEDLEKLQTSVAPEVAARKQEAEQRRQELKQQLQKEGKLKDKEQKPEQKSFNKKSLR